MSYGIQAIDQTRPAYGFLGNIPRESNSNGFIVFINQPTASVDSKTLFSRLAHEWKSQTAHLSFVSHRFQHPAYRHILGMGNSAVPLILEEMEREQDHWFHALYYLTGENPIPVDFVGSVSEATDIWLRWGRARYAR